MTIQPGDFVICDDSHGERIQITCGTVVKVVTWKDWWTRQTKTGVTISNRVENSKPNTVPYYAHRRAERCKVLIRPFVEVKS